MQALGESRALDWDVDNLPLDVFELADSGLEIESLTAGHGMLENAGPGRQPLRTIDCCGAPCGGGCACYCGCTDRDGFNCHY